jgi:hypothetical protein
LQKKKDFSEVKPILSHISYEESKIAYFNLFGLLIAKMIDFTGKKVRLSRTVAIAGVCLKIYLVTR